MTTREAVNILRLQQERLDSVDVNNCEVWKTGTKSYVKSFFGESSPEYDYIKDFQFYWSIDTNWYTETKSKIPILKQYIDNCIGVIRNRGLVKREWKHILITTHPAVFWTIFVAIVGLAFWFGTLIGDPSNKSNNAPNENTEKKNESVHKDELNKKDSTLPK